MQESVHVLSTKVKYEIEDSDSDSDSDTDSDDLEEDSFTLVKGYNERIRAIYTFRLKEKVLESLAFNATC